MDLFDYANSLNFGEVHFKTDAATGLQAIVALHNLSQGPAIGGCRFIEYPSTAEATRDALRLARGMTYKAAISGLPHGGGKAVIMRPANLPPEKRKRLFEVFGEFVDSLGGRYITAKDSGTTVEDINTIRRHTPHALGASPEQGGSGNPSPVTAFGVRRGIEAAARFKLGRESLEGVHIAIQGLGAVGSALAYDLHQLGARLSVADINPETVTRCVRELDATALDVDQIHAIDCDIYAPCALGGAINDTTLPQLRCQIVAGAANNQLLEDRHGLELHNRGILYAPDYAINAGGLINVALEYVGYDRERALAKTSEIYETMLAIFDRASSENLPTDVVADRIVEEKIFGQALR
ncbi:Glu/Leu/Phe/Val dehydrogenase family protein [Lujinxingia litoralis]|uniref:Glu/Leu/Phe/Val dehydrogenase family protein n=1 Tax=Lujinxingia litoralis TaxID=2211119 RepID=UPI0018F75884|nr:Glu/Leu/Phe/Val dehydrogenase family protein [Lujinxingia litoralis]